MEQEHLFETVEASPKIKKRPTILTIICIMGFIGAVFTVPVIFSEDAKNIGSWYPPYLAFAAITGLLCMIGLWKMKKRAAYAYTGLVVLNQIVMLIMGIWNVFGLLLPLFVVVIALYHVKKHEIILLYLSPAK